MLDEISQSYISHRTMEFLMAVSCLCLIFGRIVENRIHFSVYIIRSKGLKRMADCVTENQFKIINKYKLNNHNINNHLK